MVGESMVYGFDEAKNKVEILPKLYCVMLFAGTVAGTISDGILTHDAIISVPESVTPETHTLIPMIRDNNDNGWTFANTTGSASANSTTIITYSAYWTSEGKVHVSAVTDGTDDISWTVERNLAVLAVPFISDILV